MELVLKVGGIGLFVSILNNILKSSGRGDYTPFVTLSATIVVLGVLLSEIMVLFKTVTTMFKF